MNMTEWEQIKKEYKEIPVPADGTHRMLQAIAEAKRKRNRFKNPARYGTVAAAVVLMMLLPGMVLFSGGIGNQSKDMSMEADCTTESAAESGWFKQENTNVMVVTPFLNGMKATQDAMDGVTGAGCDDAAKAEEPKYSYADEEEISNGALADQEWNNSKVNLEAYADAISEEILRQMKERMQNEGKAYYIKSEECPEGFFAIEADQEFYINEEGLLVIVFHAGIVAPIDQGTTEFIIPAEVYSLSE